MGERKQQLARYVQCHPGNPNCVPIRSDPALLDDAAVILAAVKGLPVARRLDAFAVATDAMIKTEFMLDDGPEGTTWERLEWLYEQTGSPAPDIPTSG